MIHILFLIRSLDVGGAERQLAELVKRLDRSKFVITVATFYDGGVLWPEFETITGVNVISLHKHGRWDVFPFLWRLYREIHRSRPALVYGLLETGNIYSLLAGKANKAKVVFSLRSSYMDFSRYDWTARVVYRIAAFLSHFADLIIINSQAGRIYHIQHGYSLKNMVVIQNGIDVDRYHPEPQSGQRVRAEWGILTGQTLIGLVGRLDPMKDHANFLKSAAITSRQISNLRFVCAGDGPEGYSRELKSLASTLGLDTCLIWAGARQDMPSVYNALDILVSSSYGEGFSNAIGEAMACGIPCVVTNVGDSAQVVDEIGCVVPPQNTEALATGIKTLLALSRDQLLEMGQCARKRIVETYSVETMVAKTEHALWDLLPDEK